MSTSASPASPPKLTQHQRDLLHMGYCPFCEKQVRGWVAYVDYAPAFVADFGTRGLIGRMVWNHPVPDFEHRIYGEDHQCQKCGSGRGEPHTGICLWKVIDPTTGHAYECPLPEITLR